MIKVFCFCGACSKWRGGSIPLVRTSLLSTPTVGLRRHYFNGDGDFRSAECIELLKQADIVVTNPPFSLFTDYIGQLAKYEKNFLILGNKNAVTYKDVFQLFKENKLWIGVTPMSREIYFDVNQDFIAESLAKNRNRTIVARDGKYMARSPSIWFTNLDHKKRHEELILYKKYSSEEYPKYDNYDAIEVGKTECIPEDYDGIMGVPITFLDKYNPEQFEIVGCSYNYGRPKEWSENVDMNPVVNGKNIYKRFFIRRRKEA